MQTRLQAFKYELMLNGEQARQARNYAGACRFVFNEGLALHNARYENGDKKLGYAGLCKLLTGWRNGTPLPSGRIADWLMESPVHVLQQALKDLERSFTNFYEGRADFPTFKKKGKKTSFRYPDPKQIRLDQQNSRIFLPKLGWVRFRKSRDIPGELRNVTVSCSAGKWFISIQTKREVSDPVPEATTAVGIDVGIARFATLSDGSCFEPLSSFKRHEQRLARYQRAMSRKKKYSNNWQKAKAKVQKLNGRIADVRRDYLHKCSTTISKSHAMVCVEDLQVKNMSRSASGTTERPGKNVRAKSGLNKAILDQGWSEFRRQLEYKLTWNGGWFIAVPSQNTSRMCPVCGHVSADNRKTQAQFHCVECGYAEHADLVGAMNILARGHRVCADTLRVAACGETAQSGHSAKQEPTEATKP